MRCATNCRQIILLIITIQSVSVFKELSHVYWWVKKQPQAKHGISATAVEEHTGHGLSIPSMGRAPLCSRQQVLDGRWERAHYDYAPYVSKNYKLQCHNETFYEAHGYDTFDWTPNDPLCEFSSWNSSRFCRLVKRATVSIIGDSLSWEMYSSLLQLLGVRVHQLDQHRSKSDNKNHILKGCQNPKTKFVYRNDPRLENVKDSIKKDFPLILILNRGPHYVNDSALVQGMHHLFATLREWRATCDRFGFTCHLFWRTSVPGHPLCNRSDEGSVYYRQPENSLQRVEALISDLANYDSTTVHFHWYDFNHQNQVSLDLLQQSGLNATILDAYYLNVRRVDGHRPNDCLHNCYPGKMDVLNQLFLHFLSMERSLEEVEHLQQTYWAAYEEVFGAAARIEKQAMYTSDN